MNQIMEMRNQKLDTNSVDLSKLSDVVKNEVIKKTEYNELLILVYQSKKLTMKQRLVKFKNSY